MASIAYKNEYLPIAATDSNAYIAALNSRLPVELTRRTGKPQPIAVPLGLKSNLTLNWTSDGGKFPSDVLSTIMELHKFEELALNWDTYGAQPHKVETQRTVIDLLLLGYSRCSMPSLVPLGDGGVGLRWHLDDRELEIDVHSDQQCSILLIDDNQGVEEETENPVGAVDAKAWLVRFLQHR